MGCAHHAKNKPDTAGQLGRPRGLLAEAGRTYVLPWAPSGAILAKPRTRAGCFRHRCCLRPKSSWPAPTSPSSTWTATASSRTRTSSPPCPGTTRAGRRPTGGRSSTRCAPSAPTQPLPYLLTLPTPCVSASHGTPHAHHTRKPVQVRRGRPRRRWPRRLRRLCGDAPHPYANPHPQPHPHPHPHTHPSPSPGLSPYPCTRAHAPCTAAVRAAYSAHAPYSPSAPSAPSAASAASASRLACPHTGDARAQEARRRHAPLRRMGHAAPRRRRRRYTR
jgi:hypothetical protein